MKKNMNIEQVLDELSDIWLGRDGVMGVFEEQRHGETVILFLLKNSISNKEIPTEYKGYKIIKENTPEIKRHSE
jgi:hypothetical protein